jgi:hypothetical protein
MKRLFEIFNKLNGTYLTESSNDTAFIDTLAKVTSVKKDSDNFDIHALQYKTRNWPEIDQEIDYEGNTEKDNLDMENNKIIELTKNNIKIWCGGDWQHPHIVNIILKDGELYADSCVRSDKYEGDKDEWRWNDSLMFIKDNMKKV